MNGLLQPAARAFCERFDVELPIVNAPMAHIAGGALAGSVASAKALGLIGGGYGDADWIRAQFDLAANHSVGVGLITWRLATQPDLVARLISNGVRTFLLSFGDPSPYTSTILRAGGRLICQVQSVTDAVRAIDAGADAIVAQGNEAGGHGRDNESVSKLVPAVVDAVAPVPVLAAGGMTTGRDLATMWSLGAAGVVLGTRMYATHEALDTGAVKRRLLQAGESATVRTTVFDVLRGPEWPNGYNGRALRNSTTDEWHDRLDELRAAAVVERDRYAVATSANDLSQRVIWAGAGVDRVEGIQPAADVVREVFDRALGTDGSGCDRRNERPTL